MSNPKCELSPCEQDAVLRASLLMLNYTEDTTWLCHRCAETYFNTMAKALAQPKAALQFLRDQDEKP